MDSLGIAIASFSPFASRGGSVGPLWIIGGFYLSSCGYSGRSGWGLGEHQEKTWHVVTYEHTIDRVVDVGLLVAMGMIQIC